MRPKSVRQQKDGFQRTHFRNKQARRVFRPVSGEQEESLKVKGGDMSAACLDEERPTTNCDRQ